MFKLFAGFENRLNERLRGVAFLDVDAVRPGTVKMCRKHLEEGGLKPFQKPQGARQ